MGVGSPEDLVEGVWRGIDLFDCVLPTRLARNGAVFTRQGRMNLRNARFREDSAPIEDGCTCYTCQHFTRAYLRHLVIAKEMLAARLNTIHNLHFLLNLMRELRAATLQGGLADYVADFRAQYRIADASSRQENRSRWRSRKG